MGATGIISVLTKVLVTGARGAAAERTGLARTLVTGIALTTGCPAGRALGAKKALAFCFFKAAFCFLKAFFCLRERRWLDPARGAPNPLLMGAAAGRPASPLVALVPRGVSLFENELFCCLLRALRCFLLSFWFEAGRVVAGRAYPWLRRPALRGVRGALLLRGCFKWRLYLLDLRAEPTNLAYLEPSLMGAGSMFTGTMVEGPTGRAATAGAAAKVGADAKLTPRLRFP